MTLYELQDTVQGAVEKAKEYQSDPKTTKVVIQIDTPNRMVLESNNPGLFFGGDYVILAGQYEGFLLISNTTKEEYMTLYELQKEVRESIRSALECGKNPNSLKIAIQIDEPDGIIVSSIKPSLFFNGDFVVLAGQQNAVRNCIPRQRSLQMVSTDSTESI